MSGEITGQQIRAAVADLALSPIKMPLDEWCRISRILLDAASTVDQQRREISSVTHNYECHRDGNAQLHGHFVDARDALQEAIAAWEILLGLVPDVEQEARVKALKQTYGFDSDKAEG